MFLNVKKTKIMRRDRCREEAVINIDREEIGRVSSVEYLGARTQAIWKTTPEIRKRLAMATAKLNKIVNVWKGQCMDTTIRVLKSTFFLRQPVNAAFLSVPLLERKTERREGVANERGCESEGRQKEKKKNEQVEERSRWKL